MIKRKESVKSKEISFKINKKIMIGIFSLLFFSFLLSFLNFNEVEGMTGKSIFNIFDIGTDTIN
jgi:hypothetical protein